VAVDRQVAAQFLEVRALEPTDRTDALHCRIVERDEFVEMFEGGVMLDDDAFAYGLRDLVAMRLTHARADRCDVVVEIDRNGLAVVDEPTEFFERKR